MSTPEILDVHVVVYQDHVPKVETSFKSVTPQDLIRGLETMVETLRAAFPPPAPKLKRKRSRKRADHLRAVRD